MRYRMATNEPVEAKATKFDDCILSSTGKPYKFQKGSGRSAVIALAVDGMILGDLALAAGKIGYSSDFAVDCAWKQHTTVDGAWRVLAPDGVTMAEVKARKNIYTLTPEQEQAAKDRDAAKVKAKSARELAKVEKAEAAAAEKAKKLAAVAAAKQEAKQAAAAEVAAAAGTAGDTTAEGTPAVAAKGKGKGKAKQAAETPAAPTAPEEDDIAF